MSHSFNVSSYFSRVSIRIHSKGNRTWPETHSPTDEPVPRHSQLTYNTGGDSSNKGCFGRKTNLFRESGNLENFSGKYEIFSGH